MAPYHALDSQRPGTVSAKETLSVRKDAHNAPPPRRDWQPAPAPTIRVIHIFAPKVIKTDMANFRSTVQKLTGRSTTKSKRARRSTTTTAKAPSPALPVPPPLTFTPKPLWDQEQEQVLHRLVGDACGTNTTNTTITPPLARSNSVESSTYSLDSGSDDSPTATDSFSFYVPHRESAYSLSEIPAPFFDSSPACYNSTFSSPSGGLGLQLPPPVMESMLSFDIDTLQTDTTVPGSDVPFPILASGGSSSGGLYDMLSVQHHCRLSVQPATFQGGNFFEMI